jgi:hypothetical protein
VKTGADRRINAQMRKQSAPAAGAIQSREHMKKSPIGVNAWHLNLYDNDVTLMYKQWYILRITQQGTLRLATNIPKGLKIKVNDKGRILLDSKTF